MGRSTGTVKVSPVNNPPRLSQGRRVWPGEFPGKGALHETVSVRCSHVRSSQATPSRFISLRRRSGSPAPTWLAGAYVHVDSVRHAYGRVIGQLDHVVCGDKVLGVEPLL
jgi:hypothetical protein